MNYPDISSLWPGWRIVRLIGKGSFGEVYEIERELPGGGKEQAAIKIISIPKNKNDIDEMISDGYSNASIVQRYESFRNDIIDEYRHMAQLKGNHNIVYCDDVKYIPHTDGIGWDVYIKMELLMPLTKVLPDGYSEDLIIKIALDISNALAYCEKLNLLHRDIKPQNIFVSADGTYKLGDFGLTKSANHTVEGTKAGTYKFMSPEVYHNQPYGAKADMYSFGLTLYWLMNEHRIPFLPLPPENPTPEENDMAPKRRFAGEKIPKPRNGSAQLKEIVMKACAFDPSKRFENMSEMLNTLSSLRGYIPEPPPTPPIPPKPGEDGTPPIKVDHPIIDEPPPRPKWKWLLFGGLGVIVVVVLIILLSGPGGGSGGSGGTGPTTPPSPPPTIDTTSNWTEWLESLPPAIDNESYRIEAKQQYRSVPLYTYSAQKDIPNHQTVFRATYTDWVESKDWIQGNSADVKETDVLKIAETRTLTTYKTLQTGRREVIKYNPTRTSYETYTFWKTQETYSTVTEEKGRTEIISQQQEYRTSTRTANYLCYPINKEGEVKWSEFSDEPIRPDDETLVNVKTMYRYCQKGSNLASTPSMSNFPDRAAFINKVFFADVKSSKWYYEAATISGGLGAIASDEYLYYYPTENITVSDVLKAAVALYRIYHGETDPLSGQSHVEYALDHGLIEDDDFLDFSKQATRAETVYILWHALPEEELPTINYVEYIEDLSTDSRYYKCVFRLAKAGIISWSSPVSKFHPDQPATRAEVSAFVSRLAYPELRISAD